ncbi:MAG: UDP-N-acetylmuramoyl-tripeptide--D-alanyl-D-alanine ligase [Candidatus Krumholzibacteriota bacterium]|nr:UDP-N-acetylmuramoyl-tripeptide--D-alanyl-D-alanine ligase [Candidatus Krumholzibacteriota bacterium]
MDIKTDLEWISSSLGKTGPQDGLFSRIIVEGVAIDSRKECDGKLFVAITGEKTDGHLYVSEAVSKGARALLVESGREERIRNENPGIPVLDFPDTIAALATLARKWCEKTEPGVLGITGSAGKTGMKELAASALSAGYAVHATEGNLNNHIGVPLTILAMPEDARLLVVEMGASRKGDIKHLTSIVRPRVGIITNIGYGHLEHFGSLKGVASAKAELIQALDSDGTAVLPADDEFLEFLRKKTDAAVLTFGFNEGADYRVEDIEKKETPGYRFTIAGSAMETYMYGKHHLVNAAAVVAAASVFGVSPSSVAGAISHQEGVAGRGTVFDIGGIIFVDDSYNSNPTSLRIAIEAFMEMPVSGKRWFVLGDMLELGESSRDLHIEMGELCGKAGVDGLLTLGNFTVELSRAAAIQRKAPENISHFIDTGKLATYLDSFLNEGDCVLVKGSRGMHMEKVIEEMERRKETEKRSVG